MQPIVDRAIAAGVDILVINGNTSEFYALRESEARAMMEAAVQMAGGRAPVFNGVGRSVHEACDLARAAAKAGADGIMVEVHPSPREALCDGPQSLDLPGLRALMAELGPVAQSVGRSIA